ncbi:MAG TPA: type II toxin-antitoxin system RelE/ParE family toxin [Devosia sp.]
MWHVETLNQTVDAELEALPLDLLARLQRLIRVIELGGLESLPRDATRHLEGKLWELRVLGRSGIARTIYVTVTGQRVVLLRAFVKKAQKTPLRELQIAREREREVR